MWIIIFMVVNGENQPEQVYILQEHDQLGNLLASYIKFGKQSPITCAHIPTNIKHLMIYIIKLKRGF